MNATPRAGGESPTVRVAGVTKTFDVFPALRGVDLEVSQGESVVIVGPNGAGKTTLLKILATIMNPTAGQITVQGLDMQRNAARVRHLLGLVSHHTFLYGNLTIYENLEFYGRMYDVPQMDTRIRELVKTVGMETRLQSRLSTLSRGMQQRVSIARALLPEPSIILLDEPETGLDQQAMTMLWEVLDAEAHRERTLIMTTHNLERGFERGDRLVIMSRGRVVFEAPKNDLSPESFRQAYADHTEAVL